MTARAPAIVRELVRQLEGKRRHLDLLHRLLAELDAGELLALIPPPPADRVEQAPENGPQAPWAGRWDDVPY